MLIRRALLLALLGMSLLLIAPAQKVFAAGARGAEAGAGAGAARGEGAARTTAAEGEKKPDLIPPLTGEGSEQTYMQALWVIIIFVILLAVLYPTAWKNVLAGLKQREQRIRQDIADAEATRAKAEATLKEYSQQLAAAEGRVREMLANATAEGEKLATNIRMRAQAEAEEIKDRSQRDLEAAKNAAIRDFREFAAEVATNAAEKIIRRNLNPADQQDLVQQSLDQLQAVR